MLQGDHGTGRDVASVKTILPPIVEKGVWRPRYDITRFDSDEFDQSRKHWLRMQFYQAQHALAKIEGRMADASRYWSEARRAEEEAQKLGFLHSVFYGNLLLNAGINTLWNLHAAQGSETNYGNSNARTGVGDSSTAESATQTDLQAATNKTYTAVDATFPTTGSNQQTIMQSTYAGGSANYSWQEFIIDNGATAAKRLNRKVSNQGTKTSGQSWVLKVTVTLS